MLVVAKRHRPIIIYCKFDQSFCMMEATSLVLVECTSIRRPREEEEWRSRRDSKRFWRIGPNKASVRRENALKEDIDLVLKSTPECVWEMKKTRTAV